MLKTLQFFFFNFASFPSSPLSYGLNHCFIYIQSHTMMLKFSASIDNYLSQKHNPVITVSISWDKAICIINSQGIIGIIFNFNGQIICLNFCDTASSPEIQTQMLPWIQYSMTATQSFEIWLFWAKQKN